MQTLTLKTEKRATLSPGVLVGLGLFGLALAIRLVYALQIPFPPLDDPAYYVQGARSLRSGQPFQLGITWNYHPAFATVVRPGFDFWMPFASVLMAGCMLVMGDTPLAAQMPGIVAGAALPVLTCGLALRFLAPLGLSAKTRLALSGVAGLYLAVNPLLAYQSAVPDSQMIYAALVATALLIWTDRMSRGRAFGLGLLLGLAYITRSHTVFLGLAWFGLTLIGLLRHKAERRARLVEAGAVLLGLGLAAGPWVVRTVLTFGFVNSPAGLESGLIYDYATLFNYETPINFSTFAALGPARILEARGVALYNAWVEVLSVMFLPTVAFPALGAFLLWRRNRAFGPSLLYSLLLGLGLPLVFVAASATGSFYHSSGSLAPVGAIGLVWLIWLAGQRYRQWRPGSPLVWPVLVVALLGLELFQFGVALPGTIERQRSEGQTFARLGAWLDANAPGQPIIADEPSTVNYVTGQPALRLPADESLETLHRLADRYGVRYVVWTKDFGRYPALLLSSQAKSFRLAYRDPQGTFEVYEKV